MLYFHDDTGRICYMSSDLESVTPKPAMVNGTRVMTQVIQSDQVVDIEEYYVQDGALAPRPDFPYTISKDPIALLEETVITVPVGTRYRVQGPGFSAEDICDDGTIEFSSAVPGDYVFTLIFGIYKTVNIMVSVNA